MTPLGIDLGTTRSAVAMVDSGGRPMVLPNPLGEETTPSVVCFESRRSVLVGAAAQVAGQSTPDRMVALVKRDLDGNRSHCFDDVEYPPEAVCALILRTLVRGAVPGPWSGRSVPAVVTVPACFGPRQREVTRRSCLLAGVRPLALVSEAVAAALHYGNATGVGSGTALVYDLGGGVFDGTVLRLGRRIQVLATDGDPGLGGVDWDRRLMALLLEQFVARAAPDDDPAADEVFMAGLALTAERAKRALSGFPVHRVPIRYAGHSVTVTVSRDDFEAATRDLVDRALVLLRGLLGVAARAGVSDVDRCLLVGGASRMPMIAAALSAEFGWRPRLFEPDLGVAKGAALHAHRMTRLDAEQVTEADAAEPGAGGGGDARRGTQPVRVAEPVRAAGPSPGGGGPARNRVRRP
ncbi:Hsp70 family protein [Plantactinospora sp. ZYX-F-223]|uniref:Hsp70 family protein n=1 Tax=Plantactinospora sp. ZYX-F-223 TaxID=3144103 RepID=UPI0031FC385E